MIEMTPDWKYRLSTLDGAYSDNTIRAYRADFRNFEDWCKRTGVAPLPASSETIARFIAAVAPKWATATIKRCITGISKVHCLSEVADPTGSEAVRLAVRRMARVKGSRQRQAFGITAEPRNKLISACPGTLVGLRNSALISVGYDTLCRRSELVALRLEGRHDQPDGSGTILVRRSKADQLGEGRLAYLSPESLELVARWREQSGLSGSGPIFRTVQSGQLLDQAIHPLQVNRLLKGLAIKVGVPPSAIGQLSGHSLRVGGAQDMAAHGIELVAIMQSGGWKSPDVAARYVQNLAAARSGMARLRARPIRVWGGVEWSG